MAVPILLASNSPRRRALLAQLGILFEVETVEVAELQPEQARHLTPAELAWCNASRKSSSVHQKHRGRWVLGADTLVCVGQQVLGKPKNRRQAIAFLKLLSGREHDVITVVVLREPHSEKIRGLLDRSRVTFKPLTTRVIDRYVNEVDVMDKAGAYALQEKGDWLIENVSGSRDNVIGLPTEALSILFRQCQLR